MFFPPGSFPARVCLPRIHANVLLVVLPSHHLTFFLGSPLRAVQSLAGRLPVSYPEVLFGFFVSSQVIGYTILGISLSPLSRTPIFIAVYVLDERVPCSLMESFVLFAGRLLF